ncbi:hypothetical protein RRG08_028495 [Elysia crispata]|uniref:Chaperone DnaJ C-terminal domain-containing protein n=1 Tax=Elysia crispata TaxID=231223 RepID=A0AAE0ZAW6_9GAST|nr:hypothetical protein RRG08_028495 [Elysia crispata]
MLRGKGMKDNQQIRFSGEGDQEPDLEPGDIVIVLDEQEHDRFRRRGHDLIMTMQLELTYNSRFFPPTTPRLTTRPTTAGPSLPQLLYLLQDLQQQVLRSFLQLLDLQQQVLPSYNSYTSNKTYNSRSFAATTPIPTTRPTTAGPSLPPTTLRPTTAGPSLSQLLYLLQDLQQQVLRSLLQLLDLQQQVLPSYNSYIYNKIYNSRFSPPTTPISITRSTTAGPSLPQLLYLLQDLQQQVLRSLLQLLDLQQQVLRSLLQLLDLQQQVLRSYNSFTYYKTYNSRSFPPTTPIPTTRPITAGSFIPYILT